MRVAVLCNSPMGLPAIDYLLGENMLAGIACPAMPSDNFFRLQIISQDKKLPFGVIDENNLTKTLTDWLKQCKADLVLTFTFPYKIPAECFKLAKHGFYNFHTGVLPQYRGADPIFWQIKNNEAEGGISIHKMDENFDTGPVVHVEKLEIAPEDTYGQHIQKLALTNRKACETLIKNFDKVQLFPQDESKAQSHSRPTFMELIIDWEKHNSADIKALTRASNPTYGGAITFFRGVPVHFLQISVGSSQNPPEVKPGTILSSDKNGIIVLSSDKKLVRLDVVYTEDGFFTGGKLATTFDIKPKEEFTAPPEMPQQ